MQGLKMMPRKCSHPLCDQVFMVSQSDYLTKFHGSFCKSDYDMKIARSFNFEKDPRFKPAQEKKDKKCLDMVSSEKMEGSGMEAGEQKSNLKNEENIKETDTKALSIKKEETKSEWKDTTQIQSLKQETTQEQELNIMPTKKTESPSESFGLQKINNDNFKPKETTMQEIERINSERSMTTDSEGTHSSGSNHLSTVLKEEKENSIQSLNESSKLLLGFAKSLVKGKTDDFGEVLQKPAAHDIDAALKCVEGVRNIQKTKLDFLKFSRELQKDLNK